MSNPYAHLTGLAADPDLELETLPPSQRLMVERQRAAATRAYAWKCDAAVTTLDRRTGAPVGAPKPIACDVCGQVMRSHWHKSIHFAAVHKAMVPGQLCEYGCGKPALHKTGAHKFCCSPVRRECPAVIAKKAAEAARVKRTYRQRGRGPDDSAS